MCERHWQSKHSPALAAVVMAVAEAVVAISTVRVTSRFAVQFHFIDSVPMSESESGSYERQQAQRVSCTELQASSVVEQLGDKQQSPRKQLLATGRWAGKVLIAGTLTEVEEVADDYMRGRVTDTDGGINVYAGQYQDDSMQFLRQVETPTYVMVVGKADTYERDDGSVLVSLTAQTITEIDEAARDRWAYDCAQATQQRLAEFDPEADPVPKQVNAERAADEYAVERIHDEIRESVVNILDEVFSLDDNAETGADSSEPADEQGLASEYNIDEMGYNELKAIVASKTDYAASGNINELREKARGTYSPDEQEASA